MLFCSVLTPKAFPTSSQPFPPQPNLHYERGKFILRVAGTEDPEERRIKESFERLTSLRNYFSVPSTLLISLLPIYFFSFTSPVFFTLTMTGTATDIHKSTQSTDETGLPL